MKKLFLFFAVLALVGAGCANQNNEEEIANNDSEPIVIDEIVLNGDGNVVIDMVEEEEGRTDLPVYYVDMNVGNFFYEPASIAVQTGQVVQIEFTNVVGEHTFVIDELGIREEIVEGAGLRFVAPEEAGQYWFYCDIGNHRDLGMEGVMGVKEL